MTTHRTSPAPGGHGVRLLVDGLETEAHLDPRLMEETLLPRLRAVTERRRSQRRTHVFLVGPPGAGKSTLAAGLADAARRQQDGPDDVAVVGIDGFHHPQRYLSTHHLDTETGPVPLASIKGAPETFDVAALARHLEASTHDDVVWPTYDRRIHDVVPGTEPVTADLVVVEGNWLLLDEPVWRDLAAYAAYVVLITADPDLLRDRLVARKVRGGLSAAEAAEFYERSDRANVERVLTSSDLSKVDLALEVQADGTIKQGEIR